MKLRHLNRRLAGHIRPCLPAHDADALYDDALRRLTPARVRQLLKEV